MFTFTFDRAYIIYPQRKMMPLFIKFLLINISLELVILQDGVNATEDIDIVTSIINI